MADRGRANQPVNLTHEVHYGQLHCILVCHMKKSNAIRLPADRLWLLAFITPVDTSIIRDHSLVWPDATEDVVTYTQTQTSVTVDLAVVECVVGRVWHGIAEKKWGIIDRSGGSARTSFGEEQDWDDDDDV